VQKENVSWQASRREMTQTATQSYVRKLKLSNLWTLAHVGKSDSTSKVNKVTVVLLFDDAMSRPMRHSRRESPAHEVAHELLVGSRAANPTR
jgi:hypothetical protein